MWYEDELQSKDSWTCSTCGAIKNGIVAASNHWAQCGGLEQYNKIKNIFNNPNSTFNDLKQVFDNNEPKPGLQ